MTRHIDHLVIAVHDLDAAADLYRRLGFQVGARNRHPWGTENHIIQFTSSFLELVTVADAASIPPHGPRSFSFGAFVRDYLGKREGLAMLVLDSADARADAAAYASAGIGDFEPFSFERAGRAADGTETRVAFTLAFARDALLPGAGFFTCQQHHPESFWSPLLQRHDNAATNVTAVTLGVPDPDDHTGFLQAFTGVPPARDGRHYHLGHGGRITLEPATAATGLTGFSVGVPDVDPVARRLAGQGIPFRRDADRVVILPDHGVGTRIEFVGDESVGDEFAGDDR